MSQAAKMKRVSGHRALQLRLVTLKVDREKMSCPLKCACKNWYIGFLAEEFALRQHVLLL